MATRTKTLLAAAALALLAALAAYAVHRVQQKRALQAQVAQSVTAASAGLAETLAWEVNAPPPEAAGKLDALVAQADTALQALRGMSARPDPDLAEAADDYVASALEVLRRQSGCVRGHARFADSLRALRAHMALAGQRGDGWIAEAIRLRQQLDRDHYDYQLAATSLGHMLGQLAKARERIGARLPGVPIPDRVDVDSARSRAAASSAVVREELEDAKRLAGPRG